MHLIDVCGAAGLILLKCSTHAIIQVSYVGDAATITAEILVIAVTVYYMYWKRRAAAEANLRTSLHTGILRDGKFLFLSGYMYDLMRLHQVRYTSCGLSKAEIGLMFIDNCIFDRAMLMMNIADILFLYFGETFVGRFVPNCY